MESLGSILISAYSWVSDAHVLEVLVYSVVIPLGVYAAQQFMQFFHRKWFSQYQREAVDVQELYTKVNDRLCELGVALDTNELQKVSKLKLRLSYAASRLRKYDSRLAECIQQLVSHTDCSMDSATFAEETEQMLGMLDSLWRKKC